VSVKKIFAVSASFVLTVLAIILIAHFVNEHPIYIRGAVVASAPDPTKELPVADVEVTVIGGPPTTAVRTDASGAFNIPITLPRRMRLGLRVTLNFRHPDYQPLDLSGVTGDKLYIAHLIPLPHLALAPVRGPEVKIANVVAKYSINTTTVVNIGSAVKSFQVVNTGDIPCKGRLPCSPDGKWKAAIGTAVLDAGRGNEFHNARASCIAGPCPFTKIEDNNFSRDSRTLRVSALNWSDTATFLLEAEVYKPVVSDILRQSYPVTFDRALTFTLPAAAEGVSIEAELDATMIVFPLGPRLSLSWANCQSLINNDQTRVYRCELKPGYRFSKELTR
jgi:hypothetical protein